MILPETFTREWLQTVASQFKKKLDLKLLEKVVWALNLLEQLRLHNLSFVFKGGTSLILHFEQPRRLSIDVDIVVVQPPNDLHELFDAIIASSPFNRWVDDSTRKSHQHVPVGHYKFYYTPAVGGGLEEEPILLDILYAQPEYATLIEKSLHHPWLQVTEPMLTVQLPDINCLLGDKLTAFAPNTTGILYAKQRPLEIVKQLYDIALLFDHATDLNTVQQTFEKLAMQEIAFRELSISPSDVLLDVFETAFLLAKRDPKDARFGLLQEGIRRLNNYNLTDFRIEQAITAGAKAAYLSRLLTTNQMLIARYEHPAQIANWEITDLAFNRLNKLKKLQPEAFYYWYLALKTL